MAEPAGPYSQNVHFQDGALSQRQQDCWLPRPICSDETLPKPGLPLGSVQRISCREDKQLLSRSCRNTQTQRSTHICLPGRDSQVGRGYGGHCSSTPCVSLSHSVAPPLRSTVRSLPLVSSAAPQSPVLAWVLTLLLPLPVLITPSVGLDTSWIKSMSVKMEIRSGLSLLINAYMN